MKTLRLLMLGTMLMGVAAGTGGCILEKRVTTSYSIRTCNDVPANWDAPYYSWRLHQPLMVPAFQLNGKLGFKTPKGQGQPPTGFTWTLEHLDGLGSVLNTQVIPGTIKVRKYKGKARFNVTMPGWNFQEDDELRIRGSFDSFVPSDTIISTKLKYSF